MQWGDENHTCVGLTADTNAGDNVQIGTPYNDMSIIWNAVKSFPVNEIAAFIPSTETPAMPVSEVDQIAP